MTGVTLGPTGEIEMRCGLTAESFALGISQWPDTHLPWTITDLVPGLSESLMRESAAWAMRQWSLICGVEPVYEVDARKARILMTCRRIDKAGGVLAECELPQTGSRQCRLWLDVYDQWTEMDAQRGVYLPLVLWHELGHGIGISHAPQGSPNIMAPIYNPKLRKSGTWDISQATQRYGRSVTPMPPIEPTIPVTPSRPATPAGGGIMGGLGTLVDILTKIKPLLDLWNDPAFQEVLAKIIRIFGNKTALSADDVQALKDDLDGQIQAMRSA